MKRWWTWMVRSINTVIADPCLECGFTEFHEDGSCALCGAQKGDV